MTDKNFVSRGGIKLQAAIENWKLKIENLIVLDVGSSTGGFVDCLLQNGAAKVYSVDTSYGELAWKLRNDPKVVVMERTNILHLDRLPSVIASEQSERGNLKTEIASLATPPHNDEVRVDLVTIDAGWTKLELVLPVVRKFLKPDGKIVALLKPQYESSERQRDKGIVRQSELQSVVDEVREKIVDLGPASPVGGQGGFEILDQMDSPILGGGGNKEYLLLIKLNQI